MGLAADEAVPDKPMSVEEVNRLYESGEISNRKQEGESQIIIDGLPECYYPIVDSLDAPSGSARREVWTDGERLDFGFFKLPPGHNIEPRETIHEEFLYVLRGELRAEVGNEVKDLAQGDIIEAPRGTRISLSSITGRVRFVIVRSLAFLEEMVDAA